MNKDNIFNIPIGGYLGKADDEYVIVYSPLTGKMLVADREGLEELSEDVGELSGKNINVASMTGAVKEARELQKLAILPGHTCNFSCSYCYSAKGRSSVVLSREKLDIALEYFINPSRLKQRNLSVSFIGGGEPLLSWPIVRHGIEYARTLSDRHGFTLLMTLTTNGSIMTPEIMDCMKKYKVLPNVSFDIDRQAQNRHRRHFDRVCETIAMLCSEGLPPVINATITPDSVDRMTDMFDFVHTQFPEVRDMVFEPVVSDEIFPTPESLASFYSRYLDNFFAAHAVAAGYGKNVTCRIFKNVDSILERGCPSKFALTPQGDISICYCTSSPKEKMYAHRVYGAVTEAGVKIDEEAFDRINGICLSSYRKCDDCFARWHCGGGCMCPNDLYDDAHLEEICKFTRDMVRRVLLDRLERQCRAEGFGSLREYIDKSGKK